MYFDHEKVLFGEKDLLLEIAPARFRQPLPLSNE